jgi:hypothetical protein
MKTLCPETALHGSDFEPFLEEMAALPYREIVTRCKGMIACFHGDHSERMNPRELWFGTRVHEFYLFLTTGRLLESAHADAASYRPVIAQLVARHELDRSFLDTLDHVAAGTRPSTSAKSRPHRARERRLTHSR